MWRHASRLPECPGEMTGRYAAILSQVGYRNISIEIGRETLLGTLHLPWSETAAHRSGERCHAAIGRGSVHANGHCHVLDKKPVCLFEILECGQKGRDQRAHDRIVDTDSRLVAKLRDPPCFRAVRDHV